MAFKNVFTLNNLCKIPSIGIGTWQAPDLEVEKAVDLALQAGYRHIDCAPVYQNEKAIGRVLKKWIDSNKIKREDLFITTKLPLYAVREELVTQELKKSLSDLQLSYVDMYLIHSPFATAYVSEDLNLKRDANGDVVLDPTTDLVAVYKKMEKMVELGLAKSIGVSNFNKKQLQRIIDNSKIKPSNLQIELHLYLQQNELVDFCKEHNIIVTAYAPLGSRSYVDIKKKMGSFEGNGYVIEDPKVLELSKKYNKSPAQILLRWIVQRGVCPIPKSTNAERLKENLNVFDFELSQDDMVGLAKRNINLRICTMTDSFKGIDKHPEFPF